MQLVLPCLLKQPDISDLLLCRRFVYSVGAFIGTTEYFSHKPRIFRAVAGEQGCRLLAISRAGYDELQTRHPQVAHLVTSACAAAGSAAADSGSAA